MIEAAILSLLEQHAGEAVGGRIAPLVTKEAEFPCICYSAVPLRGGVVGQWRVPVRIIGRDTAECARIAALVRQALEHDCTVSAAGWALTGSVDGGGISSNDQFQVMEQVVEYIITGFQAQN